MLGRFLQADSIVPAPGNPQSLNRYAYVLNNPLRYTDPSGHAYCPPEANGRCIDDVAVSQAIACRIRWSRPLPRSPKGDPFSSFTPPLIPTPLLPPTGGLYPPDSAGLIIGYRMDHVLITPKVAFVGGTRLGLEQHTVMRYTNGGWQVQDETHFSLTTQGPVAVGFDYSLTDRNLSPQLGVGIYSDDLFTAGVMMGGNDLVLQGRLLNVGADVGAEFFGAGNHYVVASGRQYNELGAASIGELYAHPRANSIGFLRYDNYDAAVRAMDAFSALNNQQHGTFLSWRRMPRE